jgi:hypothetical protein
MKISKGQLVKISNKINNFKYRDIRFWNASTLQGEEFCQAGCELIFNFQPLL